MSWFAAYRARTAPHTVETVKSVSLAHAGNDAAEYAGTDLEPCLPPLGTPARAKLDREHAAMVAGLLKTAAPYVVRTRAADTAVRDTPARAGANIGTE